MTERDVAGYPCLFQSDDELLIAKPPGIAVEHMNDQDRSSLLAHVQDAGHPDAKLPHRLDRPAEGLLLIARTPEAIAHHNAHFKDRRVLKLYLAAIDTPGDDDAETLLGPHKLHLKRKGKRAEVVHAGGQPALLDVLAISPSPINHTRSHALVNLRTGRYHQLRATLAHLGAPLQGDRLYNERATTERPFFLAHALFAFTPFGTEAAVARVYRPAKEPLDADLNDLLDAIAAHVNTTGTPALPPELDPATA
jgi:23S rRNA-/tRNA-specific pseudouridylate synthase